MYTYEFLYIMVMYDHNIIYWITYNNKQYTEHHNEHAHY